MCSYCGWLQISRKEKTKSKKLKVVGSVECAGAEMEKEKKLPGSSSRLEKDLEEVGRRKREDLIGLVPVAARLLFC